MSNQNEYANSDLDNALESLYADLVEHPSNTDDYAKTASQLTKLHQLRMEEEASNREWVAATHAREAETRALELEATRHKYGVSKDTLMIVGGNIIGILVIVGHERMHLVTSKALSFIKTSVH